MAFNRARSFCFCLPVRLGIFAVTILGLLVGGGLGIAGWVEVKHMTRSALSGEGELEVALLLQTVMFTLLALVSLLGFVAICIRRRSLLIAYGITLFVHLFLNIVAGSFTMHTVFHGDVLECESSTSLSECQRQTTIIRAVMTSFFVVMWLFQCYGVVLVASFIKQGEQDMIPEKVTQYPGPHPEPVANDTQANVGSSFPVTTYNSFSGAGYPLTKPAHPVDAPGHSMV